MNDPITDESYRSPELQQSIAKHQAENARENTCPFCGSTDCEVHKDDELLSVPDWFDMRTY